MKLLYKICKSSILILIIILSLVIVTKQTVVPTYAYTQEEIDAAKAWLSANGYSPDMGGAQAAYADYMNGKFGAIPGLPTPNVQPETPPPADPVEEEPEEEKPKKDQKKDVETDPAEEQENSMPEKPQINKDEEPAEKSEGNSKELREEAEAAVGTELLEPDLEQQEFSDMIAVFADGFAESDREMIDEAQQRLENQKQERAQVEKEAEKMMMKEHSPQPEIIKILCVVLIVAAIALGVLIMKSKKRD